MPRTRLVASLLKGLDIVSALAARPDGAGLQEIARSLSLRPSTAHNLLRTLIARGFARKEGPRGRYFLGPALERAARAFLRQEMLEGAARGLGRLAAAFPRAALVLAVASEGEVLARLRTGPERPGLLERPLDYRLHPYGTACALVFQAFWAPEELAAYRRRYPFWEYGAHLWREEERLERFLAGVRRRGVARPRLRGRGVRAVAVPVFGAGGELVAALGASVSGEGPAGEDLGRLEGALRREAGRLGGGKEV